MILRYLPVMSMINTYPTMKRGLPLITYAHMLFKFFLNGILQKVDKGGKTNAHTSYMDILGEYRDVI